MYVWRFCMNVSGEGILYYVRMKEVRLVREEQE